MSPMPRPAGSSPPCAVRPTWAPRPRCWSRRTTPLPGASAS